ncbi:hypothetical protein [Nostoc sp. UHCC 0870]|uniref:hypothetical protein n=1 Tax=Nostoc sp. UHCC 0870 TaxID=2914041 RepID=UPI001EE09F1A|nr:hypothetical protein [Nostoc sp. UHCC 0870]UKO99401.1 hypothetical protein L6494_06735 [Nostoc sp. UHCC 0870]
MSRKKRTSRVVEKAELRSFGLKAVDPNMDFGNNCNLANMTKLIEEYRIKIDAYNTALAVIDSSRTQMTELERNLSELSEKMLIGVAFKYGKDSIEYEMAGGVRKSDRVRRSMVSRIKANSETPSSDTSQSA